MALLLLNNNNPLLLNQLKLRNLLLLLLLLVLYPSICFTLMSLEEGEKSGEKPSTEGRRGGGFRR
jgi:hypothetical protein